MGCGIHPILVSEKAFIPMDSLFQYMKPIDRLRVKDLEAHFLWRFSNDAEGMDGQDETSVVPIIAPVIPLNKDNVFVVADFTGPTGMKFIGLVTASTLGEIEIRPGAIVTKTAYAPIPDVVDSMAEALLRFSEKQLTLAKKEFYPLQYRLRVDIEGENMRRTGLFSNIKTNA
jgi:hypothetical protein